LSLKGLKKNLKIMRRYGEMSKVARQLFLYYRFPFSSSPILSIPFLFLSVGGMPLGKFFNL